MHLITQKEKRSLPKNDSGDAPRAADGGDIGEQLQRRHGLQKLNFLLDLQRDKAKATNPRAVDWKYTDWNNGATTVET